jgi:Tfp pilus assembly pilus retraction ATPase PilT
MSYDIRDLMQVLLAERGDAVHLHVGAAPILEIARQLHRVEGPPLDEEELQHMLVGIAPAEDRHEFEHAGLASFDYEFGDRVHFHIMAFRDCGHTQMELRRIFEDEQNDTPALYVYKP